MFRLFTTLEKSPFPHLYCWCVWTWISECHLLDNLKKKNWKKKTLYRMNSCSKQTDVFFSSSVCEQMWNNGMLKTPPLSRPCGSPLSRLFLYISQNTQNQMQSMVALFNLRTTALPSNPDWGFWRKSVVWKPIWPKVCLQVGRLRYLAQPVRRSPTPSTPSALVLRHVLALRNGQMRGLANTTSQARAILRNLSRRRPSQVMKVIRLGLLYVRSLTHEPNDLTLNPQIR